MKNKIFITLLLMGLGFGGVWGQATTRDVIYFKDGTVLRGQILEFNPKNKIKIAVEDDSIVVCQGTAILKVEKEKGIPISRTEKEKMLLNIPKEKGWYHSFAFGNIIPIGSRFNPRDLITFQSEYSIGYKFHRLFGMGINVGFLTAGGDGTIPIGTNFRGYFMKTSASLFYDLNIGYGISLNTFSAFQTQNTIGGLHLHPSIGIRFPSKRKGHSTLALGYMMQFGRTDAFEPDRLPPLFAITLRVGATF